MLVSLQTPKDNETIRKKSSWEVFRKNVALKILQNSQENTCNEALFSKNCRPEPPTLL